MQFKQNKKQEGIILMITSFNQLNNFLSFFLEKNLINKKKIYLVIFSDYFPDDLILQFKQYIEKFAKVELVDLRRKNIKLKINFFKVFFYYLLVFKKIFQMKKTLNITHMSVYAKMQFPILLFMVFFPSSQFFFLEDGIFEYVPYRKGEKKPLVNILLEKFLKANKIRIRILQLAKFKTDYKRILNQPHLKSEYYFDNRKRYKNFIKTNYEKSLLFSPKCIIIGFPGLYLNFNYFKDLYIRLLIEINKKFSYSPKQILFYPHPRTDKVDYEELTKDLSKYSNMHHISTAPVENYFFQENLEVIIGTPSSALYYANSIFNKDQLFYIVDDVSLNINYESYDDYLNVFKSIGVKNFFD
jgi:hypothetical protein